VTVLRARGARFARDGRDLVAPFSLTLAAGETFSLEQPDATAAAIAARLCAAIVKPTEGTIYVGEYETRLQPPQCKRLVGFVDAAGFEGDDHAFKCEVAFRADVWGLDAHDAQARGRAVLEALGDGAYARGVALALVPDVALVVLDRPTSRVVSRVRALAPAAGILRTR
jgi:ABC-type Na+ transport system ATPase subunit NatA